MPVDFGSIRTEHTAVREAVGKFDVSHMGEITVTGPDAQTLMQQLTTNNVAALDTGDAQYAGITNADGVLLDDTVIYRQNSDAFLFIPNAGHDTEMTERWTTHRDQWGLEASVTNVTTEYGMIAVQGPEAAALVSEVTAEPVESLGRFNAMTADIAGQECWAARTGYTGEDGFEFIMPHPAAGSVWEACDCQPCGLGARDTLRIEAGFLLSGQDFHPTENPRTPFEAGIGFTVDLDTEFVGRDALAQVATEGVAEEFVGFELLDRGVPRHGYEITDPDGEVIGEVTSGTMSPTLNDPIGLGYVPVGFSEPGTEIRVVVRGESKKAKIRTLPFVE